MNRRFRPLPRVQTPRAEGRVTFIDIVYKNTIERTKYTISCMARNLQLSPVSNEISHSVGCLTIFITGPPSLEIEYFRVETNGACQITRFNDRNNLHDVLPMASNRILRCHAD